MLKALLWIVGILVVAVAAVVAYAATLPDDWRIARSTTIKAPPEKIFPLAADLRAFNQWNPFAKQDPTAKINYGATSSGKGASYDWEGGQSGKGRMEIVESNPPSSVRFALQFDKPYKANNSVVFALQPKGAETEFTWSMSGQHTLLLKVMGLVFNMDRMVGSEFEKGLADLKRLAEG